MDEVFYLQSAKFRDTDCDIFADDGEAYMTRDQIGRALGYVNPRNGVAKVQGLCAVPTPMMLVNRLVQAHSVPS